MARLSPEQIVELTKSIHSHDFIHRMLREIEKLQRVVFHSVAVDAATARRSAEQILVAEIATRYYGDIDGIYHALRKIEKSGRPWPAALRELSTIIHSFYTTPLGILMRHEMFGDQAAFVSPDAADWAMRNLVKAPPR